MYFNLTTDSQWNVADWFLPLWRDCGTPIFWNDMTAMKTPEEECVGYILCDKCVKHFVNLFSLCEKIDFCTYFVRTCIMISTYSYDTSRGGKINWHIKLSLSSWISTIRTTVLSNRNWEGYFFANLIGSVLLHRMIV